MDGEKSTESFCRRPFFVEARNVLADIQNRFFAPFLEM